MLVQVKNNDFASAVSIFKTAVENLGPLDPEQLLSDPEYLEYGKSKEFAELKKWADSRKK